MVSDHGIRFVGEREVGGAAGAIMPALPIAVAPAELAARLPPVGSAGAAPAVRLGMLTG
jgi:hypothetical protein